MPGQTHCGTSTSTPRTAYRQRMARYYGVLEGALLAPHSAKMKCTLDLGNCGCAEQNWLFPSTARQSEIVRAVSHRIQTLHRQLTAILTADSVDANESALSVYRDRFADAFPVSQPHPHSRYRRGLNPAAESSRQTIPTPDITSRTSALDVPPTQFETSPQPVTSQCTAGCCGVVDGGRLRWRMCSVDSAGLMSESAARSQSDSPICESDGVRRSPDVRQSEHTLSPLHPPLSDSQQKQSEQTMEVADLCQFTVEDHVNGSDPLIGGSLGITFADESSVFF